MLKCEMWNSLSQVLADGVDSELGVCLLSFYFMYIPVRICSLTGRG